jgi:hypothetical protein
MVNGEAFVAKVTRYLVWTPIVPFPQLNNFLPQGIVEFWTLWTSSLLFLETIPAFSLISVPPKIEYFPAYLCLSAYCSNTHTF